MKAIIEISGSGGEIVICPLTAGVYEYWFSKGEEDLERYIADGNSGIHPPAADFALDFLGVLALRGMVSVSFAEVFFVINTI